MTNRFISKGLMMVIAFTLSCSAPLVYAQNTHTEKITLTVNKRSLETVLEKLSKQYKYQFFYNASLLKNVSVSASLQEADIVSVMKTLLSGTGLQFTLRGKMVVITAIAKKTAPKTLLNGRVADSDGIAIPGVTIFTQDKSQGAVTDIDGRFNFSKPLEYGAVLNFSSVGMKPNNVVYSGEQSLQVVMIEDVKQLEDVIITGFQTISRERSTGSAIIVGREKLDKIQAPNLKDKLEGLTAGLSTYGGGMSIRGTSSFAVGTTPLIVLDGQVTSQSLESINPDDVENITVLKDAASTSLYGVRASNGVIVVNTKKATSKKPVINVSAGFYFSPNPSLDYQRYASTSDILDYEQEYMLNDPTYSSNPLEYFNKKNDKTGKFQSYTQLERLYYDVAAGRMTQAEANRQVEKMRHNDYRKEYQDRFTQLAFTQDYNISLAKGGDKSDLYTSIRFQDFGSNYKDMTSNKVSFYLKNAIDFTKWFKFTYGTNIDYSRSERGNVGNYLQFMPYEQIMNDEGNPNYLYSYNYYEAQTINNNPGLKFMGYNIDEEYGNNATKANNLYLKLFAQADFKIAKGLDLGLKFQYEDYRNNQETYDEADSYTMRYMINNFASANGSNGFKYNIPLGGHMKSSDGRSNFMNFRGQLNYQTTINSKHDIAILAGGEIRQDKWYTVNSERYGYDPQKLTFSQVNWLDVQQGVQGQLINNLSTSSEMSGIYDKLHRYVSAYANVGYSYDGRYALNGSIRVEQADLFGTDPKYRYRPLWSVGASWNATNEEFMKSVTWLNILKFRVTYGITGNVDQSSSPYLIGHYATSMFSNQPVTTIQTPPNPMLRWEKTSTFNFGMDFQVFKRLRGSLDFYRRYSSDLLANKSLDPSVGWSTARFNNGEMKNTGFETSLSYDWIQTADWSLNTSLTAAYNKNTIEKIGYIPTSANSMLLSPGSNYRVGDALNSVYAFRYAGLTSNGDPSIYDEFGNVQADVNVDNIGAVINVGQLTPKWQGALSINLRWKSLEMFSKIVYYTGHSLRKDVTPLYTTIHAGANRDFVNSWTPENANTDIPKMGLYSTTDAYRNQHWKYADRQVVSASFIKVRNIGLSYTLPKNIIRHWGFNNISLRAQIDNPCFWAANDNDIDPEAFSANAGTRGGEQVTSYVLGLNINF